MSDPSTLKQTTPGRHILPIIVVSQFFCTSLWFAGNAIIADMAKEANLASHFLAHLTSAVQLGFISGTLVFAIFTISDRFSPSRVFFCCSILAGLFNLGISLPHLHASGILSFRFLTGFFLAGIYPVGMKIASDHYQAGLGRSLGFLVGALVLGTAFPHLLRNFTADFPWRYVIYITTALSLTGGVLMLKMVPDGPFRKQGQKVDLTAFFKVFRHAEFRSVAFGYFGHMWELYTFWAFVPVILKIYRGLHPQIQLNVPFWSFCIIACGSLACVMGGIISRYYGARKVATMALFLSCICCLLTPYLLFEVSLPVLLFFMFFWGLVVIADSPLFSTLVAQNAPETSRGTSLTIVNCIGFAITILSLQFISWAAANMNPQYVFIWLGIGPVLGLIALKKRGNIK